VDVHDNLDEIATLVENARSMPMSSSCIVSRSDLLGLLEDLRELLPEEIHHAELILGDREAVLEEGRREADRLLVEAEQERARLVAETAVLAAAHAEAAQVVAEARAEAERLHRETEDFVDGRLASFEIVLTKTLGTVARGRERLRLPGDEGPAGRDDEAVGG
jgi:cell division septum initiation protein DivIVA